MEPQIQHEAVKPICWLIGKWQSISAEGKYPSIKPFCYCESIEFESVGQPMLNYISKAWHPESKKPMHQERGFLFIKPPTNEVTFQVSHNFGLITVEKGIVCNNAINLKSIIINRMDFAKDPAVTALERSIMLKDNNTLEISIKMATTNNELSEHLKVLYRRE